MFSFGFHIAVFVFAIYGLPSTSKSIVIDHQVIDVELIAVTETPDPEPITKQSPPREKVKAPPPPTPKPPEPPKQVASLPQRSVADAHEASIGALRADVDDLGRRLRRRRRTGESAPQADGEGQQQKAIERLEAAVERLEARAFQSSH